MTTTTTVSLEIGAEHRQIRLARLVAAGIAAMQGFDVDSVDDLRISVDEGCAWLIEQGDGSALMLSFDLGASGTVQVTGETKRAGEPVDSALAELTAQILAASCVEHRFEIDGPRARFLLVAGSSVIDGVPPPTGEGER